MITKDKFKEFLLVTVGTLLVSFGVYFFKFPNNFSTGGVTGIAVIAGAFSKNLTPGTLVSILNMGLLVVGFLIFGKNFGIKTAYSSILMSGTIQLLEYVYPMTKPFTTQPFLELIISVTLPAIGSALLFSKDASTGGTDVIAMILKKYSHLNIGRALLFSDAIITVSACVAFGMETGLFSIFGLVIKAFVVDLVIESINMCKYFTIICDRPDEICAYITKELNRSATIVEAQGAFSKNERFMVHSVMSRYQALQLQKQIRKIEPTAFMMITNTSEIIGKGFRGQDALASKSEK